MTVLQKEPHLMTKAELDYAIFKMSGIKPVSDNAPKKEQDAYIKVLEIRLGFLQKEYERRKAVRSAHCKNALLS